MPNFSAKRVDFGGSIQLGILLVVGGVPTKRNDFSEPLTRMSCRGDLRTDMGGFYFVYLPGIAETLNMWDEGETLGSLPPLNNK